MTIQSRNWSGEFGKLYTERNPATYAELEEQHMAHYGLRRIDLNKRFLNGVNHSDFKMKILEVGCNTATQLECLQKMGFKNLYGIEIQDYALSIAAQNHKDFRLTHASGFQLPFRTGSFDLVFTSGVLIHIAPDDLPVICTEIFRCSKRYIWGLEYYAPELVRVPYRGQENLMWKGDYAQMYCRLFPGMLNVVKEERLKYINSPNLDTMFLLEKTVTQSK